MDSQLKNLVVIIKVLSWYNHKLTMGYSRKTETGGGGGGGGFLGGLRKKQVEFPGVN